MSAQAGVVPPEVVLDYHRRQVLARDEEGRPFAQYVECSVGCGYLIGCGDAVDSVAHASCVARAAEEAATTPDASLLTLQVTVCSLCVGGSGGECHVPGCMFWMCPAPDEEQAARFRSWGQPIAGVTGGDE